MLNLVVDMQSFLPLEVNVHIYRFNLGKVDVTLSLLNEVETWEPKLHRALNWRDLERPLGLIISLMLRSKALVAYDII